MVIKVLEGIKPTRMKVPGHLVPRRHTAPGGILIVNFIDPKGRLPKVSIISRMKGKESHFKTGNLENAIYNAGACQGFGVCLWFDGRFARFPRLTSAE